MYDEVGTAMKEEPKNIIIVLNNSNKIRVTNVDSKYFEELCKLFNDIEHGSFALAKGVWINKWQVSAIYFEEYDT